MPPKQPDRVPQAVLSSCRTDAEDDRSAIEGQYAALDRLRERCPVDHSDATGWTLHRHADVERVLHEPETFSNAAGSHLSVPNGMDPPEHSAYRRVLEPLLATERVRTFEPVCRRLAENLLHGLAGDVPDLMTDFCRPFAARAQCAYLGWPPAAAEQLSQWAVCNQEAIRAQDREAMTALASELDTLVRGILDDRRAGNASATEDITAELLAMRVRGRLLTDEELVSVLRNWTAGEVGTLAAALGIVAHYLAERPGLQQELRAEPARLPSAIEEILRLRGPLFANRRVTTRPVTIGGQRLDAGERISLLWVAANRDPGAFPAATAFRPERDQTGNLLYGAGIHVCPGAVLARMEMRVAVAALLDATIAIEPHPNLTPRLAQAPACGFARLPMRLYSSHGADGSRSAQRVSRSEESA